MEYFLIITHERHIAAKSNRVVEMLDGEIIKDFTIIGEDEDKSGYQIAPEYCKVVHRGHLQRLT